MCQRTNNLRRFGEGCDSAACKSRRDSTQSRRRQRSLRASYLPGLLLLSLMIQPAQAQEKSPKPSKQIWKNNLFVLPDDPQTPTSTKPPTTPIPATTQTTPAGTSITISDAVGLNLNLPQFDSVFKPESGGRCNRRRIERSRPPDWPARCSDPQFRRCPRFADIATLGTIGER